MFGRPLKVDSATSVGSRPSLACVLVELDITKKYPDKVWLGPNNFGYIRTVEMEVFPTFCDHCKALGHMRGECRTLSSVPVYGPATSANPLMTVGNEIGAVENVVVDGNVGAVSTNEVLCIAAIYDGGRSSVPVDLSEVVMVHSEVVDHTQEDLDGCNVVYDGIENGQGVVSVGGVEDSLALEVDNMGECNVNKVVSNVSTELVQMVEVLVNVIYNEDMKSQLAVILNDTSADHSDWLEESLSCGKVGKEVDVHEEEFNAMFNLKVNHIVEKAFSSGRGKQHKRKYNRK
ncbi:hypothetical protein M5K25_007473 [Dendrobium thyrsiflorum]|uniref:Uncharacterized protein n=1 Tax=Dendrobium thyrsiflorum TaxID=117978 RepID=A0ABD0VE22_DENTH